MKHLIKLGTLGVVLALTLTGCFLKSIHPLVAYENSQLIEGLEGSWQDEDTEWYFLHDPKKFREYFPSSDFSPDEDTPPGNAYYVVYITEFEGVQDTTLFAGSVIELSDNYYLDLKIAYKNLPILVTSHLFPVHTFSRIALHDGQLSIELFKDQWIRDQLLNNRIRLKHERLDKEDGTDVLITASTRELQEFVRKYGDTQDAYKDPLRLQKIK